MDSTRVTAFSQGDSPERWSEYDEFRWAQELLDQRRPGRAVPVLGRYNLPPPVIGEASAWYLHGVFA